MEEQPQLKGSMEPPNDNGRVEQLKMEVKRILSRRFFDLGVPLPPDMVLRSESGRWVKSLLHHLMIDDFSLWELQIYLEQQDGIACGMIPLITMVNMVVSSYNPSYASVGVLFWVYCKYFLCTLIYMGWLRYKMKLVKKYRLEIAKWELKLRKELPDQCHDYLIINVSNNTTDYFGFLDSWIYCAVMYGLMGTFFCGDYYSGFQGSLKSLNLNLLMISSIPSILVWCTKNSYLTLVNSDDDGLKVSMEQPSDDYGKQRQFVSRRLADLGVPMPPRMVLKKSTRDLIPILEDRVLFLRKICIAPQQEYLDRNAFRAFVMMPVIFAVIGVLSICSPSYASRGFGVWFCCIYVLCTLTYMVWLTYKEKMLEKFRLEFAEGILKERKELPMVDVDDVEADQCADDQINRLCYRATIPLNISYRWIYASVWLGILGILFCGDYYWSAACLLVSMVLFCFDRVKLYMFGN